MLSYANSNSAEEINMQIELKKFKYFAAGSAETQCFTADVWVNGKPVFEASNTGHGGPTDIHPMSKKSKDGSHDLAASDFAENRMLLESARAWAKTLPPYVGNIRGNEYTLDMNLEMVIDGLADSLIEDQFMKKELKRLTNKKIGFVLVNENNECDTYTNNSAYSEANTKKLTEHYKAKGQNIVILNDLPVPVAISLLKDLSLAVTLLANDDNATDQPRT